MIIFIYFLFSEYTCRSCAIYIITKIVGRYDHTIGRSQSVFFFVIFSLFIYISFTSTAFNYTTYASIFVDLLFFFWHHKKKKKKWWMVIRGISFFSSSSIFFYLLLMLLKKCCTNNWLFTLLLSISIAYFTFTLR